MREKVVKNHAGGGEFDSPGVSSRLKTRKQVSYVEVESEDQDSEDAKPEPNSRKRPAVPPPSESSAESVDSYILSSSDSDDDYEIKRQQNIRERLELMKSLGIALGEPSVKEKRKYTKIKPPKPQEKSKRRYDSDSDSEMEYVRRRFKLERKPLTSREKSKRLEDARACVVCRKSERPSLIKSDLPVTIAKATAHKPSGTLPMLSLKEEVNEEDSVDAATHCADFVSSLRPFLVHRGDNLQLRNCSLDTFHKIVSRLTLSKGMIAKTAKRLPKITEGFGRLPNNAKITSIAFHPGEEKVLVASGSTRGDLGLWDVYNEDEKKRVELLQPHTSEVSCTSFDCSDPSKIFTTSFDGTVRRGDLMKLVFEEIWAHEQNEVHATWHDQVDPHTLMVAHGSGKVVVVDCREPLQSVGWFECHEKSVRTVQKHPLEHKYFVTASGLGQVRIWDWRMMDQTKPKPVWDLVHPKGLTSAFFSCKGNLLLTTCNDDWLRIYHTALLPGASEPKGVKNIIHKNTLAGFSKPYFKAIWHPQREDVFLIGSADRKLQIFGIHKNLVHNISSEHLVTIPWENAWHPTLPLIAGADSVGKVHIFR